MSLSLDLTPLAAAAAVLYGELEQKEYSIGDFPEFAQLKLELSDDSYEHYAAQLNLPDINNGLNNVHADVVTLIILSVRESIGRLNNTLSAKGYFDKGWIITKEAITNLSTRMARIEELYDDVKQRLLALEEGQERGERKQDEMLKILEELQKASGGKRKRSSDEEAELNSGMPILLLFHCSLIRRLSCWLRLLSIPFLYLLFLFTRRRRFEKQHHRR